MARPLWLRKAKHPSPVCFLAFIPSAGTEQTLPAMPGWVLDSEPVDEATADPKGLSRSLRPRHVFKVDCPCRGAGHQNNTPLL